MVHYHDGKSDFPHGAGPSEKGWYCYPEATGPGDLGYPEGPFETREQAISHLFDDPDENPYL